MTRILAIESSCDDTSIALSDNQYIILNLNSTQLIHSEYGGVVPELASREHVKNLPLLYQQIFKETNVDPSSIDLIAVTNAPGLIGALLSGVSFAKGLAFALNKPIIGVHHLAGHIASNFINTENWKPPFINLLVSGGHTQIILVKDYYQFEILGTTIDDAVGEAFDKGAKLLGLAYPGGPQMDALAQNGNSASYAFPIPYVQNDNLNFSYSGLKTALLQFTKQVQNYNINDLCASFQKAAIDALLIKLKRAVERLNIHKVAIAGGVSANSYLRHEIKSWERKGIHVNIPPLNYCTDNAAMIAVAAYYKHQKKNSDSLQLSTFAVKSLELDCA